MAAAFSNTMEFGRSQRHSGVRHAAAHAQRLSAPAARDLASQCHRGRRGAGTFPAAATSADGDAANARHSHAHSTSPAAPQAATSSRQRQQQQSSEPPDSHLPNLPKRQRGSKGANLKKADIYGGQYRLRGSTDWVEPWVTQTIPEDRLPRWEEIPTISPEEASQDMDKSTANAIQAGAAYKRPAHHLSLPELWQEIQREAQEQLRQEPSLAGFVHSYVLMHERSGLGRALASLLANKLSSRTLLAAQLQGLFLQAYEEDPELLEACVDDLHAVRERDAACVAYIQPLLFFKGFQALQAYRLAHWLWGHDRKNLAVALQNRMSEVLHVDIHPGAKIGRGMLIDHATGVVIGETAVIGDGVSLLHRVTLGGSGVRDGKRHPTLGDGVLLGAAVSVLGPVTIGAAAKVGAGSVVTMDLPPACVAVGVPARIVKMNHKPPVDDMDQCDDYIHDYVI